jgi:hypothetical protein
MRARRAWLFPALVMAPCRRRSLLEYSRGGQAQVAHELSGVIEARQVAQFSHKSHGNRDLDTL